MSHPWKKSWETGMPKLGATSDAKALQPVTSNLKLLLKPRHQLYIQQPRRKPVRHRKNSVGEILDEQVGNGIGPVDDIEDFQRGPDIFKIPERTVAASLGLIIVQQQGAETDVHTDIGIDKQGISVFHAAGDIIRQVAPVQ